MVELNNFETKTTLKKKPKERLLLPLIFKYIVKSQSNTSRKRWNLSRQNSMNSAQFHFDMKQCFLMACLVNGLNLKKKNATSD